MNRRRLIAIGFMVAATVLLSARTVATEQPQHVLAPAQPISFSQPLPR